MTTDGHSDPDLLDLDDVPDTATLIAAEADPTVHNLAKGLRALARLAKKQHHFNQDLRAVGMWIVGTFAAGTLGVMATTLGVGLYVGGKMERYDSLGGRVAALEERAWHAGHTKRPDDDGGE